MKKLEILISEVFKMENANVNLTDAEIDQLELTELDNLQNFLCEYYNENWDDKNVAYLMNLISSNKIPQEERKETFLNYMQIKSTVLEKMEELKAEGIQEIWIQKENDFEYLYGLFGYSSIENPKYIEMNKEILQSAVKEAHKINDRIARIIY